VARGRGAWPITALAGCVVSVSGLFGVSALYLRERCLSAWPLLLAGLVH